MKIILVDSGNFYTKVVVLSQVPEGGGENRREEAFHFFGRGFFPTLVSRTADRDKGRMYYEHEGDWYAVGYDSTRSLKLEEIIRAFGDREFGLGQALLILKKIIFDYADNRDDIIIYVVVDSPLKAQVFEEIGGALGQGKVEISGFRGYDKRRILKEVTLRLRLLSSGDALLGFLEKNRMDFTKALVVDVGYRQTKLYVVDSEKGVELFQIGKGGVSFYYEKIVHLFSEEHIEDNHFLWLVKQIELGCEEVEVRREPARGMRGRAAAILNPFPKHYDISLVLENVRWDLNKEFKRLTADILTSYYTNRVEWPALLVVTGGGAALNGEILRLSLEESGYCFDEVYIEKQSIYTVLEGAGYVLRAPQAEYKPI
ncbi:MAG: hypothetical protein HY787_01345 [Deltaproteobacteria bacterium]|nr:hypothetical protein [Deltaproteobacteria bacterium]